MPPAPAGAAPRELGAVPIERTTSWAFDQAVYESLFGDRPLAPAVDGDLIDAAPAHDDRECRLAGILGREIAGEGQLGTPPARI